MCRYGRPMSSKPRLRRRALLEYNGSVTTKNEPEEADSATGSDLSVVAWQTAVLGALGLTVVSVVAHNAAICSSISGWMLLAALTTPVLLLGALGGWAQVEPRRRLQQLAFVGVVIVVVLYLPYFVYVFVGGGMASASC